MTVMRVAVSQGILCLRQQRSWSDDSLADLARMKNDNWKESDIAEKLGRAVQAVDGQWSRFHPRDDSLPRNRYPWTPEEDRRLHTMTEDGEHWTLNAIAEAFKQMRTGRKKQISKNKRSQVARLRRARPYQCPFLKARTISLRAGHVVWFLDGKQCHRRWCGVAGGGGRRKSIYKGEGQNTN